MGAMDDGCCGWLAVVDGRRRRCAPWTVGVAEDGVAEDGVAEDGVAGGRALDDGRCRRWGRRRWGLQTMEPMMLPQIMGAANDGRRGQ